jgi:hypothetical protein
VRVSNRRFCPGPLSGNYWPGRLDCYKGSLQTLREIVRDSKASVTVIAREHPVEAYIAGIQSCRSDQRIYIMTLKRNDPAFRALLTRLFTEMNRGTPLPSAWNIAQSETQTV